MSDGDKAVRGEAFVQALEIGPGHGGSGARPVSVPAAGRRAAIDIGRPAL
jgi:hypothetical protein